MIFKFLQKPLVLDCFVQHEAYARLTPIRKASQMFPAWWRELPKTKQLNHISETGTMRGCDGVNTLFTSSVALPLWSDLKIHVSEDRVYEWRFADSFSTAVIHPVEQRGSFLPPETNGHLKLNSPWLMQTNLPVKWAWVPAVYTQEDFRRVAVLPGVVDYTKIVESNVNIMLDLTKPGSIHIPANTVLVHLIPLTERKLVIKNHFISPDEYRRLIDKTHPLTFTGAHRKHMQGGKCPYSHYMEKK